MTVELKIPQAGESITEVEIGAWKKKEGDAVRRDENLVEVATDKASMELPSPVDGRIARILKKSGDLVRVGEVIALIEEGAVASLGRPAAAVASVPSMRSPTNSPMAPAFSPAPSVVATPVASSAPVAAGAHMGPAARRALREQQAHPGVGHAAPLAPPVSSAPPMKMPAPVQLAGDRPEEVVPMTLLRRKIAERLVEAQHTGALLTTFNEVDMASVTALRKEYQQAFQEKYQVKLGFMSFFVKAVVEALKAVPQVNGEIRGTDIVYKNYYDIGVAVGSGKGLVVPVIRHADRLSFAELERVIGDFGLRAKENRLSVEELQGGTFTISNGGIYGSMLSTPIINPPQSGILGMHNIQERPVVRDGQIVIRPMMYLALTYDHRLVDGREAVTFLKRVKDLIETPARLLLEV